MRLAAEAVTFDYGARRALDAVSLEVCDGGLTALVGPNGAGKSTLLALLAGLARPKSGRVTVDGRDLAQLSRREVARALGVVPQSCHPTFPVSVAFFVAMGRFAHEAPLRGPTRADDEVVARVLEEVGLTPLAARPIDELSGGEFRRVLIAQALAQEPALLLFDEPVQQLDLRHQLEVMAFARDFARRRGRGGLVVLHDLELAARFCDRIVLVHQGRRLAAGRPEEVLTKENLRSAYEVDALVRRRDETKSLEVVPLAVVTSPRR